MPISCDINMRSMDYRNEKDRHMRGVVEAVSAVGKGRYMEELSKIHHIDPF